MCGVEGGHELEERWKRFEKVVELWVEYVPEGEARLGVGVVSGHEVLILLEVDEAHGLG